MDYKFTIIIPVYNEETNLKRLKTELLSYLNIASIPTCVLFIDDGSTDNSLTFIKVMCNENKAFNYITLQKNYGLSCAIKVGFDYVNTPLLGYIDADLQTAPKDFELLLKHINNYDLITGIRHDRQDSFAKSFSSKIANRIRKLFTQDGIDDTCCPLKVIKTEYAKRVPMFKGLHRFLPAMIQLQNGSVHQVPVNHYARLNGQSKFGIKDRIFSSLIDCFIYLWIKKRYINYTLSKQH